MFTGTGRVKLLLAAYAALICMVDQSCGAEAEHSTVQDCASSCGNIHNITFPFRLSTDPKHCGSNKYQFYCENNIVMFYLKRYGGQECGFRVQAINYNNFTFRVSDPNVHFDNCGLPVANFSFDNNGLQNNYFPSSVDHTAFYWYLIFISCPYPLSASKFEEYNSPCNLTRHWYVGDYSIDLENSCRVEAEVMAPSLFSGLKNISYADVKNSFAYGFELSWFAACCTDSCGSLCNHLTKDQRNRNTMTSCFGLLFHFLDVIKITSFIPGILPSLNKTFGGQHDHDEYQRLTIFGLIIYFIVGILAILVLYKEILCCGGTICVTIFLLYKWRRRHQSAYDNVEQFLQSHRDSLMPIRYSYSEIKKLTISFRDKLGEGGYGSVYKGKLRSGRIAAIKMLDKSKADGQDFINEVATIGRIHHVNVVQLIGFCVEGSKRALVYEFMDNGSLDKHIFFKEGGLPMNSKMIFDISLGVAHGIEYLHQGCDMQILHFDIKPHNILLDEKFIPKISDFGLAKLHSTDRSIVSLTAARGTMGYIAPEFFYKNIGGISYKADVYSFGMLLMEMVGRRKNINAFTEHSSRIYFPSWIYDQLNEGKEIKLGVETEEGNIMVKKMIIAALWCIQLNPMNRPSMRKVIEMLEGEAEHLKMPPKPFVAPQETPLNVAGLNINPGISSADASCDHSNSINVLID